MKKIDPLDRWLSRRLPESSKRRLVVLTGARQTGKTTLVRSSYPDLRYLNLDNVELRESLRNTRTATWTKTVGPALLDEAQKEPTVFEKVKYAYDAGEIDFTVLLGSSRILLLRQIRETLAGRAFLYDLWPLMLSELAETLPQEPIFDELLSGRRVASILEAHPEVLLGEEEEIRRSAFEHLIGWGGMPELLRLDDEDRRQWLRSYQQTYLERDLIDLVRLTDLQPFRKLQLLAMLRSGQLLSYSKLAQDAQISAGTVRRYLEYLDLTYQVSLLQPFARNLTSSVVKSPKLYWTDLGLLRQGTGTWGPLNDAQFETFVVGEARKWISTMARDVRMSYYRTRSKMEIDLLFETPGGILAMEIKNRESARPSDARSMIAVAESLGDEWLGGLVVHRGPAIRPLREDYGIWEMPIHRLF